jgi:hypothetical protein
VMWTPRRIWEGHTVVVMASGPSMSAEDSRKVSHLPRIAVNNTYKLVEDVDIVYAADAAWWRENPQVQELNGIKVSITPLHGVHPCVPEYVRVLRATGVDGFDENPSNLRTGGNSGYQAIHLAAHLGAARILLLGYDMQGSHWHGAHNPPLKNPRREHFERWVPRFKVLNSELKKRNVDVVNCSRETALKAFKISTLEQELESLVHIS